MHQVKLHAKLHIQKTIALLVNLIQLFFASTRTKVCLTLCACLTLCSVLIYTNIQDTLKHLKDPDHHHIDGVVMGLCASSSGF